MRHALQLLYFDYSDGSDGHGLLDAMAACAEPRLAALEAELARVLDWCHAQHPAGPGPLDEGHEWDFDLQGRREWSADEGLRYDPLQKRFARQAGPAGAVRHTVNLSITGSAGFCSAFLAAFPAD